MGVLEKRRVKQYFQPPKPKPPKPIDENLPPFERHRAEERLSALLADGAVPSQVPPQVLPPKQPPAEPPPRFELNEAIRILRVEVKEHDLLDFGRFGLVYRCSRDGRSFALKISKVRLTEPLVNKISKEVEIQKNLKHRHIAKLIDSSIGIDQHAYLLMELLDGGNLFEHVKSKGWLREGDAKHIFQQLVQAVSHLHTNGIVHLDLKLENIACVSTQSKASKTTVKIIDFGCAEHLDITGPTETALLLNPVGTKPYWAPEMCEMWTNCAGTITIVLACLRSAEAAVTTLTCRNIYGATLLTFELDPTTRVQTLKTHLVPRLLESAPKVCRKFAQTYQASSSQKVCYRFVLLNGTPLNTEDYVLAELANMAEEAQGYDKRSLDVWALGVILFLMLEGKFPFHGEEEAQLADSIRRGGVKFRKEMPVARDLVKQLLQVNPTFRTSVEGCKKHAWYCGGASE